MCGEAKNALVPRRCSYMGDDPANYLLFANTLYLWRVELGPNCLGYTCVINLRRRSPRPLDRMGTIWNKGNECENLCTGDSRLERCSGASPLPTPLACNLRRKVRTVSFGRRMADDKMQLRIESLCNFTFIYIHLFQQENPTRAQAGHDDNICHIITICLCNYIQNNSAQSFLVNSSTRKLCESICL